jgi:chromosome segregation ATPase
LIDGGVAKLVDNYYVRPLNDYRLVLRRLRLRLEELAIRKSQLEIEQKVLDDAIAATVKMLASNQESKLKLEKDLAQIQVERSAIDKYNATVKEQLTNTRSTLSGLYRENLGIRQQLDEISRGIEASLPR